MATKRGHNPPKFKGKFDPEEAQRWLADVEKIFHPMGCREEHKVNYATYMLCGEAEDWWRFASQMLPQEGDYIQWEAFKASFLRNYFHRDLKKQKAWEFLELKQGSVTGEHEDGKEDMCTQFEHGLRLEICAAINVFQLTNLPTLVSKCRIFEANSKDKTVDTRGNGPMRQDRRPHRFSKGSYSSSSHLQSKGTSSQERSSESGSGPDSFKGSIKYFKCGGPHMLRDYPQPQTNCGNCEKLGHTANMCWAAKRSGSASTTQRPESRGSTRPSTGPKPSIPGKVFVTSGAEASQYEELIRV
ncbi:uncharacterized protein LOC113850781 [Abrus precatorius]|uniref:Uncharacterized protein LOC113850781 n=1 Tax=Abrus precatorius TaxID=3816 RepID=A0A8B8K0Y8_ABRPR|nr:uncharacterized protein LOC113850781 [Abrus precatorius]